MRIAENHHAAAFDISTQTVHIHGKALLGAYQRVEDYLPAAMLRDDAEGMIDGLLDKNLITWIGEALHTQVNAADNARYVGNFLAFKVHAKLLMVPTADIVPIGIVAAGITQYALLQTLLHGFQYKRWGAEIHIGHPHGYGILVAAAPFYAVVLHTVGTKARNYFGKFIIHDS